MINFYDLNVIIDKKVDCCNKCQKSSLIVQKNWSKLQLKIFILKSTFTEHFVERQVQFCLYGLDISFWQTQNNQDIISNRDLTHVRYRDKTLDPIQHLYPGAYSLGSSLDDAVQPHWDWVVGQYLDQEGFLKAGNLLKTQFQQDKD